MQVALFWQGFSISHGALEILQVEPIDVGVEQGRGVKLDDVCVPTKAIKYSVR
jgi:hypothetical protein